MNFDNKVVLITGAGSGIGRATALLFSEKGAKVAVNDILAEKGKETVDLIKSKGKEAVFILGDVSIAAEAEKIVIKTVETFEKLNILINNAGIVLAGKVEEVTEEDFEKTMRVNVKGPLLLSKYAIPEMKKVGGGVIVNVASIAALRGVANRCIYSVSKGALISLTRSIAKDYLKENIRVNTICPGTTYTKGLAERIKNSPDPEAMLAEFMARQPSGRLGKVEEIAQAILFAACDEAAFMTGSIISIDGGGTL